MNSHSFQEQLLPIEKALESSARFHYLNSPLEVSEEITDGYAKRDLIH